MRAFPKINQFYVGLVIIMILVAVMAVISLRTIFSAISVAGQVDESLLSSTSPRVDSAKIDKALDAITNKEFTPLDLR